MLGRERALLAAARPLARTFLDLQLPDERAFGEIQRLVENLVAMHELLRDAGRLDPARDDARRMVVAEAMRTFTYLNLYGYVTDAVVVNRVFPDEVDGYFGAWRAVQAEQLELVESGFAPVPVLRAPYFEREVLSPEMLDRLGAALFDGRDAGAVLHGRVTQELSLHDGGAELRLDLPFAGKGDVSLKKIRARAHVVRVDGHKRTIMLPGAMAAYRPSSASLAGGSLVVGFTDQEPVPEDPLEAVRDAERLVREATERAEQLGAEVPPSGFQGPRPHPRRAAARRRSRTCPRWRKRWTSRAARCRPTCSASSSRPCASC